MQPLFKLSFVFLLLISLQLYAIDNNSHKEEIDFVVAKDGSGDYTSIQEAINGTKSFPYERITIFIKKGTYNEKVKIYQWNPMLTIIGESKEETIIEYNDYFDAVGLGRNSTFHTATLQIDANDCIVKNLTISNSAGPVGQAISLAITSNRVIVENCNINGNQDTVYVTGEGNKQYFKNCYIEGSTDFIFGQATAVFNNCTLHSKSDSYITAASTPKGIGFGLVFINCRLTAATNVGKVCLGRPWRVYAKTVFINCNMGQHILPQGWDDWDKPDSHQKTFYAEYNSTGLGKNITSRVSWSHQLTKEQYKIYTVKNILKTDQDDEWYLKP
ncbi:pectinesterase family protein [Galbibacter sp. PAP.153]|uniref:pectinesterase family protein n=1 Tax=Galbibacter sp. PAP.153 TaxID=3104623 RepID=UPI003008EE04